ncbi:MAG: efflux RND transporter periplasmic adaptor subunit [Nodosilinea sp.]
MQDLHSPPNLEISDAPSDLEGSPLAYDQGPKAKPWLTACLGLGAGVLLTLLGTHLATKQTTPAKSTPAVTPTAPASSQAVTVTPVLVQTVADTLAVNGTVKAMDLLSITPQVNGLQIRQVLVREGETVVPGQVLARLDDTTLQADRRQAQAQLSVAQAQVAQRQAALAQARANLAEAQQNLDRSQALASRGAISQQELTRQRTQVVTVQESVGLATADLTSAQAGVRSQQAALERLQTQISQTAVRAPAAGIVAERRASVGDISSAGTAIVTLIQNNQLKLAAEVPQTQISKVTPGAPVAIRSTSDRRLQLQGVVQSIDPVINAATRTAIVNISLPASPLLKSGMFLQGNITVASRSGLTIPATAIQPRPDGSSQVFVVNQSNQVSAREVTLGNRLSPSGGRPAQVEILKGLESGEQVVTSGVGFLQDGDTVNRVQ